MLKDDNKPLVAMSTSGTLNRSRRCSLGGWSAGLLESTSHAKLAL
ncbi:hypothetical protein NFJ02_22g49440 [Pycnococcus provasolii]